jgi:hypothetical protein
MLVFRVSLCLIKLISLFMACQNPISLLKYPSEMEISHMTEQLHMRGIPSFPVMDVFLASNAASMEFDIGVIDFDMICLVS